MDPRPAGRRGWVAQEKGWGGHVARSLRALSHRTTIIARKADEPKVVCFHRIAA